MRHGLVIARSKNWNSTVRLSEILTFTEANRKFESLRSSPIPEKAARIGATVLSLLDVQRGEVRRQRWRVPAGSTQPELMGAGAPAAAAA